MMFRRLVLVPALVAGLVPFAQAQQDRPAAPPPLDIHPQAKAVAPPPAAVLATPAGAAHAIGNAVKGAIDNDVAKLRSGPLLIHGNYCGIGNRPGKAPVDALDAACMRHDACTQTGKLPNCACDDRLRAEATVIAQDPRTPPELQVTAAATASAMALLVCKITPHS